MCEMADDHWQTKCLTISERTRFIFNNELLSDVKFIVPTSNSESESQKMIPAHKFVLAIGSPVFYAMFFGKSGVYSSEEKHQEVTNYYGFTVFFDDAVPVKQNNCYEVVSLVDGFTPLWEDRAKEL